MEQGAQVRVTGPSRVLMTLSTGALVGVTSVATAVVVLSGTTTPGQLLDPRPPAAAAPGQPPVVVLPPGALGTGVPQLAGGSRGSGDAIATSPRRTAGSTLVLSLAPELSAPVPVPAGGLLPPLSQPPHAAPALPSSDVAAATRPGKRRGATKDEQVLTAPLEDDAPSAPTSDGPSDSLSGTTSLLSTTSDGTDTTSDADEAERDRREFAAQERGRRLTPATAPAVTPRVVPAVPAVPAVPGVARAVPLVPPSPAAVERTRTGAGKAKAAAKTAPRGKAAGAQGSRTTKASAAKKKQKKASGSSSGRRAPQGGRGSGRGPRS